MTEHPINDPRRFAPATLRNRDAIRDVLRRVLPASGAVLEVASGSGEHAVFFAESFPNSDWWPSDVNADNLASINAWAACGADGQGGGPINLHTAHQRDVCTTWNKDALPHELNAIVAINMVHIAPWEAAVGLFTQAGRVLPDSGLLYLYGPFRRDGTHTADSNAAFDVQLRSQDPRWGIRDIADLQALADASGFGSAQITAMPANNFSLCFFKGREIDLD